MVDEIDINTQTPQTEAPQEPILTPEPVSEPTPEPTAQMGGNEPLATEPEPIAKQVEEVETPEVEQVEKPQSKPEISSQTEATLPSIPVVVPKTNPIRELLNNARFAIQTRKKKKLEKIMLLFAKRTSITNDEVEKLLHISDATATRYLTILKKENKIKQNGKTGKGVSYSKI